MLTRGPAEITQIRHGITTANAQFMPEEPTAIREDCFHLNNSRPWHLPVNVAAGGMGIDRAGGGSVGIALEMFT